MSCNNIPSLHIGELEINPPIIQGGMGVRVSMAGLASAVANQGAAGVIASVGLGPYENSKASEFVELNNKALRNEIRKARSLTKGIIGVNVMVVLSNYEELIKICVEEKVDIIISGSGLPLDLPKLCEGTNIKLIPIVSSLRAFNIIYRKWKQNYNKIPDAVIVEGVMAGGHLGYDMDDITENKTATLEELIVEISNFAGTLEKPVPVIAAGGIFDGSEINKFLKLGASGVQMATRFVCTDECDVHPDFKQAYINSEKDDIIVIKSPVGLPGRVIKNKFVEDILAGKTIPFKCAHHCLRTCDPKSIPYCIAKVLASSSKGLLNESFVFAGSNAYRCTEIVSVETLINQIKEEMLKG